jgi:hypothetical protein
LGAGGTFIYIVKFQPRTSIENIKRFFPQTSLDGGIWGPKPCEEDESIKESFIHQLGCIVHYFIKNI